MYWTGVVDMFDRKEHKTDKGKEKIVKIKSAMNNFRTDFTWDHLQNFYNVKYKIWSDQAWECLRTYTKV